MSTPPATSRPVGNAAPPRPKSFASLTAWITPSAPEPDRGAERLVAAVGAVVVDRTWDRRRRPASGGADDSRPSGASVCGAPIPPAHTTVESGATIASMVARVASPSATSGRPGSLREDGRRLLAHPETWRSDPGPAAGVRPFGRGFARQLLAEGEPTRPAAREVVTDMDDVRRSLLDAEHRVERRHAVGVGGRDGQPLGYVVETAPADPPHAALERVQGRQQEVALVARLTTSAYDPEVARGPIVSARPPGLGFSQEPVHRRSLRLRRGGVHQMEVHAAPLTRPPRRSPPEASPPARRSP